MALLTERAEAQDVGGSAPICAMLYVNDSPYLLEDEKSKETWTLKSREAKVEYESAAMKCREDNREEQALQVVLLRNTRVAEEMFAEYGMKSWSQYSCVIDLYKNRST